MVYRGLIRSHVWPTVALLLALVGEGATTESLVWSQVVLSLQLSFAVIPLLLFTGDLVKTGPFVNPRWVQALAWPAATLTLGLTRSCCSISSRAAEPEILREKGGAVARRLARERGKQAALRAA